MTSLDWKATLPHSWLLQGLPDQPETLETLYTFSIGPLEFPIPGEEQGLYVHIPEIHARDAERPRYPEQEAWVSQVLATYPIKASKAWWAHWRFASEADAIAFEKLLWAFGAMRLWTLSQPSREPDVLIEHFFFTITPSETGTFRLSVVARPSLPALEKRGANLVRRVIARHRIPARKQRGQNCWEFETIDGVQRFEKALQDRVSRFRARTLTYAGQL